MTDISLIQTYHSKNVPYSTFQVSESEGTITVICMVRRTGEENSLQWPDDDDILDHHMKDPTCTIDPPEPHGKFHRGYAVASLTPEMLGRVHDEPKKKKK
jgi:hypothetical protein